MRVADRYRGLTVEVLLDHEDYIRFSGMNWSIDKDGYVRRNQWINGSTKTLLLHRCVLNVEWESADETCVDHINGNRLDNRKENLRIVSYAENAANRHAVLTSTGYLRVSKSGSAFSARVRKGGVPIYVGSFSNPRVAEKAVKDYMETGAFPYEKRKLKKVIQKTINGDIVAQYASCAEASRKTGICSTNIVRVANHDRQRKQAGGFLWEYAS